MPPEEFIDVRIGSEEWTTAIGNEYGDLGTELPICFMCSGYEQIHELLTTCKERGGLLATDAETIGTLIDACGPLDLGNRPVLRNILTQLRVRLKVWDPMTC